MYQASFCGKVDAPQSLYALQVFSSPKEQQRLRADALNTRDQSTGFRVLYIWIYTLVLPVTGR